MPSAVVACILLLSIPTSCAVFALAWTIETATPPSDARAMTYCGDHPFQEPYCRAGRPMEAPERPGVWCGPLLVNGRSTGLGGPVSCVEVNAAILVRPLPSPSP